MLRIFSLFISHAFHSYICLFECARRPLCTSSERLQQQSLITMCQVILGLFLVPAHYGLWCSSATVITLRQAWECNKFYSWLSFAFTAIVPAKAWSQNEKKNKPKQNKSRLHLSTPQGSFPRRWKQNVSSPEAGPALRCRPAYVFIYTDQSAVLPHHWLRLEAGCFFFFSCDHDLIASVHLCLCVYSNVGRRWRRGAAGPAGLKSPQSVS